MSAETKVIVQSCLFAIGLIALAAINSAALAQGIDATKLEVGLPSRPQENVSTPPHASGNLDREGPSAPLSVPEFSQTPADRSEEAAIPEPKIIHQPAFSAAGVIAIGEKSIRLAGVAVTEPDARCGSGLDAWPCGRMARAALQRFVRQRTIECRSPPESIGTPDVARCTLAGHDLGEWLVVQGWAKSDGPQYANAEKVAQQAARGIWSPLRAGSAPSPSFNLGPALANAALRAEVSLASQRMTLIHRGRTIGQWSVSTARDGKVTPTGIWTAKWLSRHHRSRRYNDAPMPYAVFYDGDYAIHGTDQTGRLGRPASAGCIRLDPRHAAVFFNLVREEGLNNTLIVIR